MGYLIDFGWLLRATHASHKEYKRYRGVGLSPHREFTHALQLHMCSVGTLNVTVFGGRALGKCGNDRRDCAAGFEAQSPGSR